MRRQLAASCALCVFLAVRGAIASDNHPCVMAHWTGQAGYSVLGWSTAVHGQNLLVGEPGQSMVRRFRRSGGAWVEETPLTGSQAFGTAIAVDGDRCVVTSPGGKKGFVYDWNGTQWTESSVLQPSSIVPPPVDPRFGYSAAIGGDTIAIGAYHDEPKGAGSGSVFVYRFNGVAWAEEAKLSPSDGKPGDRFGYAVGVAGDRVVASATGSLFAAGAVYVFERDRGGKWSQAAKIPHPEPKPLTPFAEALAVTSEEIWAGARLADGLKQNSGAVYVFSEAAPGNWILEDKVYALTSEGGSPAFGSAIARAAELTVIGAPGDQQNGGGSGAAFVFHRDSQGQWTQVAKLIAPEYGEQDNFGWSVAIGNALCVVGAVFDEPAGYASGSAYLFAVGPDLNNNGLMDPCECPGDLNKDWIVDQADLGLLLANWGCTGGLGYDPSKKACPGAQTGCCGDLDADGDVDQADLGVMLQNVGNVCP